MSEIIAAATIRAITSQTVKDVTDLAKNKIKGYQALKKLTDSNDDLMASLEKLMLVKTLFSGAEKPVNLFDFFQKPKLTYLEQSDFTIENLNEISSITDISNKNLIFRGTVGQGKSIFMRFLAIKDIVTTQRIPIFIELKNVSKNKSVKDLIKEYLAIWIGDSEDIFNLVLQSGKVSIFLDAFDEIDSDLVQFAYKDINDLCQNYRKLTVIVSSRPDTLIINSQYFNVIDLQPYDHDEQVGLIKKLVKDKDNKNFLIEAITKSTHEVRHVLKTPLMVVLFIKQYTVGFSVPNHVVDFYKNIFDVVTFTHDRSKGIEKRKSFSTLNQIQLERVFERFCFETFLAKTTVFNKNDFIRMLKKSIEKNNIKEFEDYNRLIDDYTRFACLILQDGVDFTFIHKSIQEFYVSRYVSNLNEDIAKKVIEVKFYNDHVDINCLEFLKVLKKYYYDKYYALRAFNDFGEVEKISFNNTLDSSIKFFKNIGLCEINHRKNDKLMKVIGFAYLNMAFYNEISNILDMLAFKMKEEKILTGIGVFLLDKNDGVLKLNISYDSNTKAISDIYTPKEISEIEYFGKCWKDICDRYNELISDIKRVESQVTEEDLGL